MPETAENTNKPNTLEADTVDLKVVERVLRSLQHLPQQQQQQLMQTAGIQPNTPKVEKEGKPNMSEKEIAELRQKLEKYEAAEKAAQAQTQEQKLQQMIEAQNKTIESLQLQMTKNSLLSQMEKAQLPEAYTKLLAGNTAEELQNSFNTLKEAYEQTIQPFQQQETAAPPAQPEGVETPPATATTEPAATPSLDEIMAALPQQAQDAIKQHLELQTQQQVEAPQPPPSLDDAIARNAGELGINRIARLQQMQAVNQNPANTMNPQAQTAAQQLAQQNLTAQPAVQTPVTAAASQSAIDQVVNSRNMREYAKPEVREAALQSFMAQVQNK